MRDEAFEALLAEYLPDKPPRVWSLLVTLFGDLAQEQDAFLSGATLQSIFDTIGIKPEALRVALHRLRKDGWIESTRNGRASNYSLTEWGRLECQAASPLIYGEPATANTISLIIADPANPLDDDAPGLHPIGSNLFLSNQPVSSGSALVMKLSQDQKIPDWITERLCPKHLVVASTEFLRRLRTFEARLPDCGDLTPVQTSVMRGLIVHDWRRIVLKVPQHMEFAFPKAWKGPECRERVTNALTKLGRPVFATRSSASLVAKIAIRS